jgi:hypothetical protein
MTIRALLRRPSGFLPVAMSATAVLTIGVHLALAGTAPQANEGAAAHLWQLLMGLQIPFVAFFAIRSLPEAPRPALAVLALQVTGMVAALAPVALLHW